MPHVRYGQHFLTRPEIAGWVADAAEITNTEAVLEVGPGQGILTDVLLARAGKVVAIEKDPVLVEKLRVRFSKEIQDEKLILVESDIREYDPSAHFRDNPPYSLVANIPYYITGEIIRKFITSSTQPHRMTLLVQKEVAERVVAKDGKESLLSLSVKAYGQPHMVRTVKAGAFSPPPKVDSAILTIDGISRHAFRSEEDEILFFHILHAAFRSKRKIVRRTLEGTVPEEVLLACGIAPSDRPEDISLTKWLCCLTKTS